MTTQIHFSQIDVEQEIASKIQRIAAELAELREAGGVTIDIAPSTLFYLEALGYVADLTTGLVTREVLPASQATDTISSS